MEYERLKCRVRVFSQMARGNVRPANRTEREPGNRGGGQRTRLGRHQNPYMANVGASLAALLAKSQLKFSFTCTLTIANAHPQPHLARQLLLLFSPDSLPAIIT